VITYHLRTSQVINAAAAVKLAMHDYQHAHKRKYLRAILRKGWDVPAKAADALLTGKVPYQIAADGAVIFTINDHQTLKEKFG
jgi:hypothetical protein